MRIRLGLILLAALLTLSGGVLAPGRVAGASPVTFNVDTLSDTIDARPGDNTCADANAHCSLRAAIMEANAERHHLPPPPSFIVNLENGRSYLLTIAGADEDEGASGDLDIRTPMSIVVAGGGHARVAGTGGWLDRIFDVNPDTSGAEVQMTGLTIEGGHATSPDFQAFGGGIVGRPPASLSGGRTTSYRLTLTNTTVVNNTADLDGGGIDLEGNTLILKNSTVSGNTAAGVTDSANGGGINAPAAGGTLMVIDSTISGNAAPTGFGGGINSDGTATVTNSMISGNTAGAGGGFNQRGNGGFSSGFTATLTNTTISGNSTSTGDGGGIAIGGPATVTLNNVTIADNKAGRGGGISNAGPATAVHVANTIVADNLNNSGDVSDCFGPLSSQGFNLIGNTSGCTLSGVNTGNVLNRDPRLGPLQNNGGATQTQALLGPQFICAPLGSCFLLFPPSAAVDVGNPATPGSGGTACPATDQRGTSRPIDGNGDGVAVCDIGAYEAPVGTTLGHFTLTLDKKTAHVHKHLTYTFTWTVPSGGWRSLEGLHLLLRDEQGTALWLRFHEVAGQGSTLSLIDPTAPYTEGPAFTFGSANQLETDTAIVYLATSSVSPVEGPPVPTVTLTLDLGFKEAAAHRDFDVSVMAVNDSGQAEGFVPAGTLKVEP